MNSRKSCLTTILLFAALVAPIRLAAQEHTRYKLIDVNTLGGPNSFVNFQLPPSLNKRGAVVGSSQTIVPLPPHANGFLCAVPVPAHPGPNVYHAFEWKTGLLIDLGALPPSEENCSNAVSINDRGEIVGGSENGLIDPQLGITEVRAVLWRNGEIEDLGTFGGNESAASAINNRGQVAGIALNTIPDPYSIAELQAFGSSNGTQTRAFLWQNGNMQDLGTLGGNDALVGFLNERGQIAGESYTNTTLNPPINTFPCISSTGLPTVDPFLWENGKMIDLGTLGGTCGFVIGLNNRGQVFGLSNLAGDNISDIFFWDRGKLTDLSTPQPAGTLAFANWLDDSGEVVGALDTPTGLFHAALWRKGVLTDLRTLPGDCGSEAWTSNRGVVGGVSVSCDGSLWRAFLWQDGSMVDLNTLIPRNSSLQLIYATAINDRGEIDGTGVPPGVSTATGQDTLQHASC
jgi:probable HAF family extracellular repeat protein